MTDTTQNYTIYRALFEGVPMIVGETTHTIRIPASVSRETNEAYEGIILALLQRGDEEFNRMVGDVQKRWREMENQDK